MTRYVLTGTTGRLGSRILSSILEKGNILPSDLIISTSNPAHVPAVAREYGVEIRYGDYTNITSMRLAMTGADVLFLMSHPDPGIQRVTYHRDVVEAARAVGIRTVVYSSMMLGGATGMISSIGIQQGHIHTTKYLTQAGIDHIIIRQGIYAEVWANYVGIRRPIYPETTSTMTWAIPKDFSIAYASLDELGEANAVILAHYEDYIGQTLRLTGPRATSVTDIARLVEENTQHKVDLQILGDNRIYGWFDGLCKGEGEVVDSMLGKLLGRPPRGIAEMTDGLFAWL
ncbi:hypothetical protein ACHAQJ_007176 [Trichoderma viride]